MSTSSKKRKADDSDDSDDENEGEVEVLQEVIVGKDGKQQIQYDVNYGALMSSGRYEKFNETRVICMERDGIELRRKQQFVGGQYGGIDDAETHEYTAIDGGAHNYGGYGGGSKAGESDVQVRKRRKELASALGLKPPPEEGAKSKVLSRAEQLETQWYYWDISGQKQGPFSESQMTLWHDQGGFGPTVEVQSVGGAKCTIASLSATGRHPFKGVKDSTKATILASLAQYPGSDEDQPETEAEDGNNQA